MTLKDKEIQKILSIILHDTKKPFNNLKMLTTILKKNKNDPDLIDKSLPSLNSDADKLISFIKMLKDLFSETHPELIKRSLQKLVEEPIEKFSDDFKDVISINQINDDDTIFLFDVKNLQKGFSYLFKRLFELFQFKTLDKLIISYKVDKENNVGTILIELIGNGINNLINKKKMNSIFFEEDSLATASDLPLSLFKKFLVSSQISFKEIENNESNVVIEVKLNLH